MSGLTATMYSSCFSNFRLLTYFQSDYTRCCINTVVLLRMSTELLETYRGFKETYHRRKVCVKLVIYQNFTKMHGPKNINHRWPVTDGYCF
jgi:hypothetical protein